MWTGTWASGSITVDGLSNYTEFVLKTSGNEEYIYVTSKATSKVFRGGGVSVSLTPTIFVTALYAERNGNTLTMKKCVYCNPIGENIYDTEITEIIGLL